MSRLLGFSRHGSLLRFSPSRGSTPSPFCSFDDVDACHAWLRRLFVHLCPANYRWFYEKNEQKKKSLCRFWGEREGTGQTIETKTFYENKKKKNYIFWTSSSQFFQPPSRPRHDWEGTLSTEHPGRSTQHMIPSFPPLSPPPSSGFGLALSFFLHRLLQSSLTHHQGPLRVAVEMRGCLTSGATSDERMTINTSS